MGWLRRGKGEGPVRRGKMGRWERRKKEGDEKGWGRVKDARLLEIQDSGTIS